ncbi:MAG: hypothetical protein ABW019_11935 [Chitinophagaceae bacterium]
MGNLPDIFHPASPNHAAMFARLFSAVLTIQLLISFRDQYLYFKSQPSRIYGKPARLLGRFRLPVLSASQFMDVGFLLLLSLVFIVIGFLPRLFALSALICYVFYFNSILSLAYVQRKTNLLPLVLLILVVSPSVDEHLFAASTTWELVLVKIGLSQVYLSAGIQKLQQSGWDWCTGRSVQAYLLENYLWSDRRAGLLVAQNRKLCAVLATLTLAFELTFWIIIFIPSLTCIYLAAVVLFHTGTLATMRINYGKYLLPVYMVFFTDLAFWAKDKFGL